MADGTHIEWTDATWNIVNGCSVLSPGCTNCYAMRLAGTRLKHHESREGLTIDTKAGPVWTGETRFNDKVLLDPLKWRRPRKIFVCAHGDLFHESVPEEWIDKVFSVMAQSRRHVFQVLTKRPERARAYLSSFKLSPLGWLTRGGAEPTSYGGTARDDIMPNDRWPLPNVWLGVSVEDQKRADERIPILLATPAAVRWLSMEPLLGPIEWKEEYRQTARKLTGSLRTSFAGIDWIVLGGESGPGARPMHPDWARSIRDICAEDGVPFLFKQWGEFGPDAGPDEDRDRDGYVRDRVMEGAVPCAAWVGYRWEYAEDGYAMPLDLPGDDHEWMYRLGKKRTGRLLDGVQHDGYPA